MDGCPARCPAARCRRLASFAQRSAAKAALDDQQASQKVQQALQLAASDTVQARTVDLEQVLPIAGPLRASNAVMVKARVAGELQGLALREGDFVQAGAVVATVDSTEFAARLRQAQQQAEWPKRKSTLPSAPLTTTSRWCSRVLSSRPR